MNGSLAQLLNGNLDKAEAALGSCRCANSTYMKAVIAARKGQASKVGELMEEINKVPEYAVKASKDIEFAKYRKTYLTTHHTEERLPGWSVSFF